MLSMSTLINKDSIYLSYFQTSLRISKILDECSFICLYLSLDLATICAFCPTALLFSYIVCMVTSLVVSLVVGLVVSLDVSLVVILGISLILFQNYDMKLCCFVLLY